MAKEILAKFDAAAIRQALNAEIPDLEIESLKIIETGWDHLVAEVNEKWIFRFPRKKASIKNLQREKKLLAYLKSYISLAVPQYQFFGKKIAFAGYQKLPGIHLNKQIYHSLDPVVKDNIALTLATFFCELHASVSKEQAREWGYGTAIRPLEKIATLSGMPDEIKTMLIEAVDYAEAELSKEEMVFIHQDVNGDNSVLDENLGQITGVFDFSDVAIGPYSWEFAALLDVDIKLARKASEIYAAKRNVKNPLIGGASDFILRKATFILEARESGDLLFEEKLYSGLKDFLPIWNEVNKSSRPK